MKPRFETQFDLPQEQRRERVLAQVRPLRVGAPLVFAWKRDLWCLSLPGLGCSLAQMIALQSITSRMRKCAEVPGRC